MEYSFKYDSERLGKTLEVDLDLTIDHGPRYDTPFGPAPRGAAITKFEIITITSPTGEPLQTKDEIAQNAMTTIEEIDLISCLTKEISKELALHELDILNTFWSNQN